MEYGSYYVVRAKVSVCFCSLTPVRFWWSHSKTEHGGIVRAISAAALHQKRENLEEEHFEAQKLEKHVTLEGKKR